MVTRSKSPCSDLEASSSPFSIGLLAKQIPTAGPVQEELEPHPTRV